MRTVPVEQAARQQERRALGQGMARDVEQRGKDAGRAQREAKAGEAGVLDAGVREHVLVVPLRDQADASRRLTSLRRR